ncbi:MAG: MBL fold metallo-hydrolase [Myxococcales bacterium]|nr:MBL fold metallo-hydrolase [Myxococcales bacterium]
MKKLHRPDLFSWSCFDEARNIDFNSLLWVRPAGNVVVDPLPLSAHDRAHLLELGGAALIIVTNSDHVREALAVAELTNAEIAGPGAEREKFPIPCGRWLVAGDEPVPGMKVLELHGSKTPGELALLIGEHSLVTGDLVRAHQAGSLCLLPDAKLGNRAHALESLRGLLDHTQLEAVLVGDGWPIFRDGHRALRELAASVVA